MSSSCSLRSATSERSLLSCQQATRYFAISQNLTPQLSKPAKAQQEQQRAVNSIAFPGKQGGEQAAQPTDLVMGGIDLFPMLVKLLSQGSNG